MKFTGHERDTLGTCSQTDDLDYMHARFYNPTVGRFLSPDPLRGNPAQPLSWNLYAYVLNNPLNFFDPLGLETARPTKLADEITVIGSDPCPGVPAGIPCDLWQSVQRDLQHFFWESAMRRLQEGYPQWLSELRNDLGVQLGYSIIGALTPAEEPEVTLFDQAYELWWKKPSLGLGQQDGAKYWGPIGNAFYIFTGGNRGSSCVGWACGLYQALSPMNTASTRVRLAQTKIRRPRFLLQLLFGSREAPVHTFVVLQVKRGDYWVRVRTYDPFWRLR
jgi:RHS repeat-associated protein